MGTEREDDTEQALYLCTCPICEKTSLHEDTDAHGSSPVDYLRSHIWSTTGGGHGADYALPDDLDEASLEEYVERV